MKVLLANPATRESISETKERYFIKAGSRWPWSYIKKKKEKTTGCSFPFFIAYTASILRDAGHDVQVIDGVAMDMKETDFLHRAQKIYPDLILIETATHSINHDLSLCRRLKKIIPAAHILLCGAHATVFAHELLESNSFIDFIASGEYEFPVLNLAERLQDGADDFRIDGISFRSEDSIWKSDKKGFIKDLNKLPYPAFDLLPCNDAPNLSVYGDGICTYFPSVTLHSSRGCPYKCDFCMWNQIIYDNGPYRMFAAKRVVDEMAYVIKNYGAREIYFDDDDFCISKDHVLEICKEIKERKLCIKWSCMGDAMSVDEEMLSAMAGSGCIFMKFGVESGSKDILKKIGKPLNPEKAIKVAEWCREYGIMTHATFSFGLDGETFDTMHKTLKIANSIKFDTAQVSIVTPFPGTRYYEKLINKGFLRSQSWDSFDGTMSCTFSTDTLSAEDIEAFRKKAIKSMVLHKIIDPAWVWNFLKRNYFLLKNYGLKSVLAPVRALFSL